MKPTLVLALIAVRFLMTIAAGDDWKMVESYLDIDIPFKWSNNIIEVKTKPMSELSEDSKLEISFNSDMQNVKYNLRIDEFAKDGDERRRRKETRDYWEVDIEYEIADSEQEHERKFMIPALPSDEPRWTFKKYDSEIQVMFEGTATVSGELPMFGQEDHVNSFRFTSGDTISLFFRVMIVPVNPG